MNAYANLGELLKRDLAAYDYFTSLPVYARSMIAQHSENMHSLEELQNYADNVLRGDR